MSNNDLDTILDLNQTKRSQSALKDKNSLNNSLKKEQQSITNQDTVLSEDATRAKDGGFDSVLGLDVHSELPPQIEEIFNDRTQTRHAVTTVSQDSTLVNQSASTDTAPPKAGSSGTIQTVAATHLTRVGEASGKLKHVLREQLEKYKNFTIIKSRFVLESKIGEGGMGSVYKARDLRKEEAEDINPYVALKVLNDDFKKHPAAFKALQREAKKSQVLAHPNIVTVYDFDRDGDLIYMTMELLEGHTLKEIIKNNPQGLGFSQATPIIEGMVNALSYAHKNNIVHSDFKPGNIFITNENSVKIFDFGIARAVPRDMDDTLVRSDFDAGSLGALTPTYASLEMLTGKTPDPRDDLYALACISYELLCGKHPYYRLPATQAKHDGLIPNAIDGLQKGQWQTLLKSLSFDRELRIESADAFFSGLFPDKAKKVQRRIVFGLAVALTIAVAGFVLKPSDEIPQLQELSAQQISNISELLETAQLYISLGQYAAPPGDSALDLYNHVLEIDPINSAAIDGKTSIAERYYDLAKTAFKEGQEAEAILYVRTGLLALPTHDGLKLLKTQNNIN